MDRARRAASRVDRGLRHAGTTRLSAVQDDGFVNSITCEVYLESFPKGACDPNGAAQPRVCYRAAPTCE